MKKQFILFFLLFTHIVFSQITDTGNKVGVGASSPTAKLHIYESTMLGTTLGNYQILAITSGNVGNYIRENKWLVRGGSGNDWYTSRVHNGLSIDLSFLTPGVDTKTWWERDPASGNQFWGNGSVTQMALVGDKLGIGTTTPDSKLSVNGNIHTKEVKVDLIGWSDFVFTKNYDLPTLEEVEQHIQEKGHLKDIPSEEDVQENGIFLGEMDAKLLQKIEELTLYIIDQQKEIEKQKAVNENLIEKLKKQDARLENIETMLNSIK